MSGRNFVVSVMLISISSIAKRAAVLIVTLLITVAPVRSGPLANAVNVAMSIVNRTTPPDGPFRFFKT